MRKKITARVTGAGFPEKYGNPILGDKIDRHSPVQT